MESKNNESWKDIITKDYNKDFSTLTQDEINLILQNIFYQYFMIDVDSIRITSNIDFNGQDFNGHYVKFEIAGEAYRDGDGLPNYLTENIVNDEDEYYDEEYDEED